MFCASILWVETRVGLGLFMLKDINKMFKAIKDDKIIAINDSGDFPCLVYDSIEEDIEHQLSDYIHCDGQFVLTVSDEAIEQRKEQVRAVRNQYLKQTDEFMIVDYPITDDERELYKQYRTYLRDYTLSENWQESEPQKFEEWVSSISDVQ